MALIQVTGEELATVVTTLEMRERPRPRPFPGSALRLVPWKLPPPHRYRTLFARVGSPWLWFSRLAMIDAQLTAVIHDPAIAIFAAVDAGGIEVGMLELDFRQPRVCTLAYLGLVPGWTGKGHGRWLMGHALALGWRPGVEWVQVNTCTLDHPSALGFYRASGFVPVARTIETFPDPRISGLLPRDAAPQVPLLASRR
ncbi:MAG TPA: GNAT family N-acetyltransferase [Sphingomonas sp.]